MATPVFFRSLRPFAGLLVLGMAIANLVGCSVEQGVEKPPERGDRAVARVDGRTVWASDVKREAVAQGLIGEGEPLDTSSDLFHRVMEEVVDQKLLAAEAIKRKLDKDPAAQHRLTAARERILGDLLVEGTVTDAVNENAIRGLYQEQLKLAKQSEEIHARQVVLGNLSEAEAVKKLLMSGASFEALAMERSTDSATRFNGGDLGYFTIDVMPQAYESNLKGAKVGQIVGPFEIDGGWAIVKIEDRRLEQPITLEAARPQIVRFLTYDQVRDLLEKLRHRAKVVTLIKPAESVPGQVQEPAGAPRQVAPPADVPAPASAVAPVIPPAPVAKAPKSKVKP